MSSTTIRHSGVLENTHSAVHRAAPHTTAVPFATGHSTAGRLRWLYGVLVALLYLGALPFPEPPTARRTTEADIGDKGEAERAEYAEHARHRPRPHPHVHFERRAIDSTIGNAIGGETA